MASPDPSSPAENRTIPAVSAVDGWSVVRSEGSAAEFHHTAPPAHTGPQIWIRHIPRPALILGSTQPNELVLTGRAERDGIEVCRRRSGGGLVYIDPKTDCWVDVIVPNTSGLWRRDIGAAFHWVGHTWAEVLGGSAMASERSSSSRLGNVWCFADLGHGEVSIDGSKVVGLSQRRTRTWARIQCLVVGAWAGERLRPYVDLDWLADTSPDLYPDVDALDPGRIMAGPPAGAAIPPPVELAVAFVSALPTPD